MTILITGARGNIGSRLVADLTRAGHAVRATTRDLSAAGLPADVETVELDVADPHNAAAALRGVESVFLYAVRGEITPFLDAARDAGVEYVVLLSSPASFEAHEHDRHIGRVHRAVERSLEDSELPHTVLYPSWLATNANRDWAERIRATGSVALPFPDAQVNPIHPDDVAGVAARLLTDPACRARLQVLTGPESLRLREIVAALGEVLSTQIRIDEVTRQRALDDRPAWIPEAVLDVLLDAERAAVDVVERLTGHPARTFGAWAREHAGAFAEVVPS
jgi:uncharacterized protein YbjT (DUF2867 family)